MAISDLLRGCPLFFELYDAEIEKLTKYCSVYTFAAGDVIVEDGQEGNEIYVILEGEARIEKRGSGEPLRIQGLVKGDPFGEMVLVDERKRSATIVAESDASILEIKYGDVFNLYEKEPRIFGLIMLNLSRLLARRLKETNRLILKLQEEARTGTRKAS